jgi:hypothetical protein
MLVVAATALSKMGAPWLDPLRRRLEDFRWKGAGKMGFFFDQAQADNLTRQDEGHKDSPPIRQATHPFTSKNQLFNCHIESICHKICSNKKRLMCNFTSHQALTMIRIQN